MAVTTQVPLVTRNGVMLIEGTRVPIDTIIGAFQDGYTADEINHQYPTVSLAAVHQVIEYYLQNRAELDGYVAEREKKKAEIRAECEQRRPTDEIVARIQARRSKGIG